ncbi:cell wall metabolism sensor histidine kinase WalK [Homoserinimonas sp. OAct 916]|uniref:sensor histidine kinase n=1 Tax=Homoserinimonas sp. OAct 916 TaxID=2211450 RepID=UPI000DBE1A7D|nr:HAMP domain-containing sensor histidine kinase [Homoserinimonas sp. OAct 916]
MHPTLSERWNAVSLRSKITGVTVLVLTFGLLVSGIGTMAMIKPKLVDQLDAQLESTASGNLNSFLPQAVESPNIVKSESGDSEYFVALFDAYGNLVNRNWMDTPSAKLPVLPTNLTLETGQILTKQSILELHSLDRRTDFHAVAREIAFQVPNGARGTAIIAVATSSVDAVMATYLAIFLGFGIAVVAFGALLTRVMVTSTFAPLREVEQTAAAIAEGDFSQRLPGPTPNTEVGRLNRSLNTMLSRIDRAFLDRARTIDQMRRFVGDASHELRTPLVSVRGYAELYRMGALQSPEEVAQAMDRIEKEAIRMGGLVEDLLELARLDETRPREVGPVDLVPIARDAALDAMASAPGRVVTVVTNNLAVTDTPLMTLTKQGESPSGDLPEASGATAATAPLSTHSAPVAKDDPAPSTGPIALAGATIARLRGRRVRKPPAQRAGAPVQPPEPRPQAHPTAPASAIVLGEENKLRQVVTNLMGNAARFTNIDTPIEIAVAVDEANRRATLEVIDHGEGIPEQIRQKIFQRFWRADSSRTRETGGSGLGLAIVSSIVSSHGGVVEALETPGGGATFRVTLPLLVDDEN